MKGHNYDVNSNPVNANNIPDVNPEQITILALATRLEIAENYIVNLTANENDLADINKKLSDTNKILIFK